NKPSSYDTTFENIQAPEGRVQLLHETAERITRTDIPDHFRQSPIVHIGPLANEVDEDVISNFSNECLLGVTPQGWLRRRSEDGHVIYRQWLPSAEICRRANAVVISDEDVGKDERVIQDYAQMFKLFVVTEGFNGARVYWHGDVRLFSAPKIAAIDATGAGDIFAATFFIRLKATNDPWTSAETAVKLASLSVTRKGLNGVPTPKEVQSSIMEIIKGSSSQPRRGASQ
ncbi:MAG: hypothetical protein FJZ98_04125, partial [Chloroflexi bacterium]|nr:hypothetical protein [Chloroflexota bacterium]